VDNNYRKIGETRASALRQMLEGFLRQAEGHKTQLIEVRGVEAEDEDLVDALKQLGFKRYTTSYAMRKTTS